MSPCSVRLTGVRTGPTCSPAPRRASLRFPGAREWCSPVTATTPHWRIAACIAPATVACRGRSCRRFRASRDRRSVAWSWRQAPRPLTRCTHSSRTAAAASSLVCTCGTTRRVRGARGRRRGCTRAMGVATSEARVPTILPSPSIHATKSACTSRAFAGFDRRTAARPSKRWAWRSIAIGIPSSWTLETRTFCTPAPMAACSSPPMRATRGRAATRASPSRSTTRASRSHRTGRR